jgi:hypothetical protein
MTLLLDALAYFFIGFAIYGVVWSIFYVGRC